MARTNADRAPAVAAITAADLQIDQVVRVDVTGDPRPDLIVVDRPKHAEQVVPPRGMRLFVDGDLTRAVTLLGGFEHTGYAIVASYDLDGDGRRELVYRARYPEGSGLYGARVDGSKLVVLGRHVCGYEDGD